MAVLHSNCADAGGQAGGSHLLVILLLVVGIWLQRGLIGDPTACPDIPESLPFVGFVQEWGGAEHRASFPFAIVPNAFIAHSGHVGETEENPKLGRDTAWEADAPIKLIGRVPRIVSQCKFVLRCTLLIAGDVLQPFLALGARYAGILMFIPPEGGSGSPTIRHVHDGNRVLPQHSRQSFDQATIRIAHVVRRADAMLLHERKNGGNLLGRKIGNGGRGHV